MQDFLESEFFTDKRYQNQRDFLKILLTCFVIFATITSIHKVIANKKAAKIKSVSVVME